MKSIDSVVHPWSETPPLSGSRASLRRYFDLSWMEILSVALLMYGVHLTSHFNYLLFHSLAELFSICIGVTIFVLAINCWQSIRNQYVLFVGLSYFFVCVLDLLHTLTFKGMPIFTDYDYYAPQFWVAARAMEAVSALLAIGFLGSGKRINIALMIAVYTLITAGLVAVILHYRTFPVCFIAGSGLTPFKVYSEYAISAVLLLNILLLYRKRQLFDPQVLHLIQGSQSLMVATELCFTLYVSNTMSDMFNQLGHLFDIVGFFLMYKAVVVTGLRQPLKLLFRDLKTSEGKLLEAQHMARLGSWECDLDSGACRWTSEVFHILGVAESSTPSFELMCQAVSPAERPRLREAAQAAQSGQEPFELLLKIEAGAGEARFAQIRAGGGRERPVSGAWLSGTVQDVTEQQRMLLSLQLARQSADLANAAKSAFLANMSHEIRTPMNAIIGLAHLLRRDAVLPRQIERLDKVSEAAQSLLGILNDILDFSKIEAGKLTLEEGAFDLEGLFQSLLVLIGDKASDKGLEIITHIDPRLPHALYGDRMRLGQILLNLANNAVKFTDSGMVALRARLLEAQDGQDWIRFEVCDSGIGLSLEQRARLFQPFEQADTSITRRFGGTGLGLAICKRLTELMAGRIGVESVEQQGSTFWFEVPLHAAHTLESAPVAQSLEAELQVLVVDDLAEAREAMADMLRNLQARVALASSGPQALAMVEQQGSGEHPFDLLLLDWKMPGMDGLEVARKIRGLKLAHFPKVILVTAYGRDYPGADREQTGIVASIAKPVSASQLFDTLVEVSSGHRHALARASSNSPDLSPLQGRYLLLAEDNRINQEVALDLLREAGLTVDLAQDGVEAVELARRNHYELVLMDIQMPRMDGLSACAEIRRIPGMESLPIIAMTANAFAEERQACLDAGMNDHIAKPVDPDQMFATILSCLPANRGPATGAAPDASVSVEPAPPDFPDIVARLASIDGLDVAAGLSLLKQKVPSYLRILRLFAELHAQDGARLGDALARQAWSEILQLAHALKGAAGNIHADGIRVQAAALEGAARREHALELEAALPPLQRALPRLCAALLECLPPTPAPGRSGALDAARQSSILGQLQQLLQADDLEAQHFFREHRDELNPLLGDERFALLGPLIERFAYVEALRLLPIHDE